MLANYIHIRCVNLCPSVFIPVGISIHRQVDSQLDKTRPVALKTWPCLIFKKEILKADILKEIIMKKVLIVKLKASKTQAERRKLTVSVFIRFVLIAILCLKPWVVSIILGAYPLVRPSINEEDIKLGSKERTRGIETRLYTGKRLHCQ